MATINNATYGRSQTGLGTLKSAIQKQCSIAISKLTGPEYTELVKQINTYWAGSDANDWLKDLKGKINSATTDIKKISSATQSVLDADLEAFKKQQSKNVTK